MAAKARPGERGNRSLADLRGRRRRAGRGVLRAGERRRHTVAGAGPRPAEHAGSDPGDDSRSACRRPDLAGPEPWEQSPTRRGSADLAGRRDRRDTGPPGSRDFRGGQKVLPAVRVRRVASRSNDVDDDGGGCRESAVQKVARRTPVLPPVTSSFRPIGRSPGTGGKGSAAATVKPLASSPDHLHSRRASGGRLCLKT